MSSIRTVRLTTGDVEKVLSVQEGHFTELKARDITPAKLSRTVAAFSNAEGGELFVGIDEDTRTNSRTWRGFDSVEDANGHLQLFEELFPLGAEFRYEFLESEGSPGFVLHVFASKTKSVKKASDGKIYVRRSAQNLPISSSERLKALERDKGLSSFEDEVVACDLDLMTNSEEIIRFMLQVVPTSEPEPWLRKQMLIIGDKPAVAGVVLFCDEPQAILPKRSGIKIYRYKTSKTEGTRDTLDFEPLSIEGPIYQQIKLAVTKTQELIESVRVRSSHGLESVHYPQTALHEIITNAVLHRDYSIPDDIHIRIFDNRVEVLSPGTLPGHVTAENILNERFARNSKIVRLINKFPDPPNKDVGEGLNTAFLAMRQMQLKPPQISQTEGYVSVVLRHESLASPEEAILEYLKHHSEIANRDARELCSIGSENKIKRIFQQMVRNNLIELVPGRSRYNAAYRLPVEPEAEVKIESF